MKLLIFFILILSQALAQTDSLSLKGSGKYTWFLLNIYTAELWSNSEKAGNIYKSPLKLKLTYHMKFRGEEIVDQSIKELERMDLSREQLRKFKKDLLKIFPDVKSGQSIIAYYQPKKGVRFSYQDNNVGEITNIEKSKLFLDIWLGKKTSAPKLRAELLGISE